MPGALPGRPVRRSVLHMPRAEWLPAGLRHLHRFRLPASRAHARRSERRRVELLQYVLQFFFLQCDLQHGQHAHQQLRRRRHLAQVVPIRGRRDLVHELHREAVEHGELRLRRHPALRLGRESIPGVHPPRSGLVRPDDHKSSCPSPLVDEPGRPLELLGHHGRRAAVLRAEHESLWRDTQDRHRDEVVHLCLRLGYHLGQVHWSYC
mmetsp:Transcript_60199/g.189132  ORF Transcript_60199/g.189132 Transcript_60199/m.189132 type:complete len:207 (-) Transcript_60199:937-1557(-)